MSTVADVGVTGAHHMYSASSISVTAFTGLADAWNTEGWGVRADVAEDRGVAVVDLEWDLGLVRDTEGLGNPSRELDAEAEREREREREREGVLPLGRGRVGEGEVECDRDVAPTRDRDRDAERERAVDVTPRRDVEGEGEWERDAAFCPGRDCVVVAEGEPGPPPLLRELGTLLVRDAVPDAKRATVTDADADTNADTLFDDDADVDTVSAALTDAGTTEGDGDGAVVGAQVRRTVAFTALTPPSPVTFSHIGTTLVAAPGGMTRLALTSAVKPLDTTDVNVGRL